MRAGFAAAALAVLVIAAPAAAQPSGPEVLRSAVEALARSHGPEVRDYAFTLVYNDVRMPVFVQRGDEEWTVHTPEGDESPMGSLMSMAVMWPAFVPVDEEPVDVEELQEARYLRTEQVGGRSAHVVTAEFGDDLAMEGLDSAYVYVDAENGSLLRILAAGSMPEESEEFAGGAMRLTADMLDHRETDGVVVPRRLHVRMDLEAPEMSGMERAQMTMGMTVLRAQLQGSDDPEAREMLAMLELLSAMLAGEGMELPMTVEELVVNAGPPAWLDGM